MSDTELIETLSGWVNSLADDAKTLQAALEAEGVPREARRFLVGGLAYLLRKIDIVPDYLSGVGVVDDAMALRIAAGLAVEAGLDDDPVRQLGESAGAAEGYLGNLYPKLVEFVRGLPDEVIRGRNADNVLDEKDKYEQFLRELHDELSNYAPKPITDGDKALREIKSFFRAKLDK